MAATQCLQLQCTLETKRLSIPRATRYSKIHNFQTQKPISIKSVILATTRKVFDEMPKWDTFAWNNVIQTHLINGEFEEGTYIYLQMLLRGVRPDKHTLPRILTASRLSGCMLYGKQVHGHALKLGLASDKYVLTTLMELYGHFDGVQAARSLFDQSSCKNSVSWTLLARLYTMQGKPVLAIETFKEMMNVGAEVDAVALATVLGACGSSKLLQEGRRIHEIARKLGLESNVLVGNSLMKMYLDCASTKDARMIFDKMHSRDLISWTAIVQQYVKNGEFNEAIKLFRMMNATGLKPDAVLVSGILPACARVAAGKQGKELHAYMIRSGIESHLVVQNAVLDMYMKTGSVEAASNIFLRMKENDDISLTVMIFGYSSHGYGEHGLELYHREKKNIRNKLDDIMYDALLHACSTARMVDEGKSFFKCMKQPKIEHCLRMVSLLSRAGLFEEAKAFIDDHKMGQNAGAQRALLDGCRIYQDKKMAKRLVEGLIQLEPLNPDNYVLSTNLYAAYGQWDLVEKFKEMVRDMGLKTKRAYSWIELRNKVHVFGVGDVSHPRSKMIYYELEVLMKKMKDEEQYVVETDFSLHDVDEERECFPMGHSEMLAISFGLINVQAGLPVRISKNLRVCRNCHSSAKIISKIVGREIVLKDPNHFHHFKDGYCSCGDFW